MKSLVGNSGVYIKVFELPVGPLSCSCLKAQLVQEPGSSLLCLCVPCYHYPSRSHWSMPDCMWHPQNVFQVLCLCVVCFPVFSVHLSCSVLHRSLQPGFYLASNTDMFHRWFLLTLSTASILRNIFFSKSFLLTSVVIFLYLKEKENTYLLSLRYERKRWKRYWTIQVLWKYNC